MKSTRVRRFPSSEHLSRALELSDGVELRLDPELTQKILQVEAFARERVDVESGGGVERDLRRGRGHEVSGVAPAREDGERGLAGVAESEDGVVKALRLGPSDLRTSKPDQKSRDRRIDRAAPQGFRDLVEGERFPAKEGMSGFPFLDLVGEVDREHGARSFRHARTL